MFNNNNNNINIREKKDKKKLEDNKDIYVYGRFIFICSYNDPYILVRTKYN